MKGLDGRIEIEGCDTIPKLFWHQVKARDGRTAFREKELGIWRATTLARVRRARALDGHGPGQARPQARRGRVDPGRDRAGMALCRHGHAWAPAASRNGIYPTDSAKQVDYILNDSRSRFLFVENDEQLDKFIEVRGRCPQHRQGLRLRHGRPGRFQRSAGHAVRRAAGARPRARRGASRPVGGAGRGSQGRRARPAGLHLGHHRPGQGRDAVAPQRHLPDAQRRRLHPARHRRRAARLPAALPHRRAHLHRLPAAALRRHRQLRRERRDGAREHPRGGADHLLRRAAHLGDASIPASPSA